MTTDTQAEHTADELKEARRWGFADVKAWREAMKRSGLLEDCGFTMEEGSAWTKGANRGTES